MSPKKNSEEKAIEAAAKAEKEVESEEKKEVPNEVTLSNGIVLRLRRVAPLVVREAVRQVEKPQPPKYYRDDKGREEENPNDPEYLEALEEYEETQNKAAINAILLLGTEPVHIPEDVQSPDNEGWIETLRFLGIKLDVEDPRTRYLCWLRFYALAGADDMEKAIGGPMLLSGVPESEVMQSIDSFRGDDQRGSDSDSEV